MTEGHRPRARCGGRERWRWLLTRAGTGPSTRVAPPGRGAAGSVAEVTQGFHARAGSEPSTRVAPPGRGAAGSVAEVTESVVGEVVVQRASARWPRPGLLPLRPA
jgi:hypothetical protein